MQAKLTVPSSSMNSKITVQEIKEAEIEIIKAVQNVYYPAEKKILEAGGVLQKGELLKMTPFLDKAGIIRVEGRINNGLMSFNSAHPIILPKLCIPADQDNEKIDVCP